MGFLFAVWGIINLFDSFDYLIIIQAKLVNFSWILAQYDELPVYKSTYDLLLAIFQFTKNFSIEYKYTVGESLKKETIELLTLIYRANSRYQKTDLLQSAREQIEVIRLLIRVMKYLQPIFGTGLYIILFTIAFHHFSRKYLLTIVIVAIKPKAPITV